MILGDRGKEGISYTCITWCWRESHTRIPFENDVLLKQPENKGGGGGRGGEWWVDGWILSALKNTPSIISLSLFFFFICSFIACFSLFFFGYDNDQTFACFGQELIS